MFTQETFSTAEHIRNLSRQARVLSDRAAYLERELHWVTAGTPDWHAMRNEAELVRRRLLALCNDREELMSDLRAHMSIPVVAD